MDKSAGKSPIQQAALVCYRLHTSQLDSAAISDEDLTAIQSILGSPVSALELVQFAGKLHQSGDSAAIDQSVFRKWGDRLESGPMLSDAEALALIQELFGEVDHAIMYDQSITASSSRFERGFISDTELQFPGKMPCWTLHLTVAGRALFLNDNMDAVVGRGDMMLFHPEARYHYGLHPAAEHWEHLWVLFQPRPHWSEWLEWSRLDDGILQLSLPDKESIAQMEDLLRRLITLKDYKGPYQDELQHNRLEEILIRAKEYSSLPGRKLIDKRIQRACDYIQTHVADGFSVDDVAAACNLSASRTSHLFKQHMGVSLKSWSSNLRLQQARKKLVSSNDSISLVARQVGYDDPAQFTKYFKKNMGCSPREFRRAFKGSRST